MVKPLTPAEREALERLRREQHPQPDEGIQPKIQTDEPAADPETPTDPPSDPKESGSRGVTSMQLK